MLQNLFSNKYWKINASICCIVITLLLHTPKYNYFYQCVKNPGLNTTINALDKQIAEPFSVKDYPPDSHESKMAFRLTMPLIGHVFGVQYWQLYILQFLFGCVVVWMHISLLYKILQDQKAAFYLTICFVSIYAGCAAFIDIYACFDAIAVGLMLIAMNYNSNILLYLLTMLAYFIDERSLLASIILILWFYFRSEDIKSRILPIGTILFSWLSYILARYLLTTKFGLHITSGKVGLEALKDNINNVGIGIYLSFSVFWLIVVYGIYTLYKNGERIKSGFMLLFVGAFILSSVLVHDITRSMSYFYIIIPLSMYILNKYNATDFIKQHLTFILLLGLITPVYIVSINIYWISPFFVYLVHLLKT